MTTFKGQRFEDSATLPGRLIKVPAAATAPLIDNRPLGANVAMVLHNNVSHLCNENLRHLAWWQGAYGLQQNNGWTVGPRDATQPNSETSSGVESEISWSRLVSHHFGPFCGVQDRRGPRDEALLRRIVVDVDFTNAATAGFNLYAAITQGFVPTPPYAGVVAVTKLTDPGTGVQTINLDATATIPRDAGIACRPNNGYAAATAYPVWFWVWVGWYSTDGGDRINAVSIYEQRD